MSKKTKGILKFLLTLGIVLSAAAAVFAIITRMQRKLAAEAEVSDEEIDDEVCSGSCAECGMCDTEDEVEAEEIEE